MKKVLASIMTVVLLAMVFVLPITAYASDITTGSMNVTYDYSAPEGGDPEVPSTYTVNIPANVSNEDMEVIPITVSKNNISNGKMLLVTVDWDKSYDSSGYFNLYKNKGETDEESIRCRVLVYKDSTLSSLLYVDFLPSEKDSPVATFMAGGLSPSYGGNLKVLPLITGLKVSSGTYSGTLYFNIQVANADEE